MAKTDIIELDIPENVHRADSAVEVFRAWIADGALHVTFDPQTFSHDVSEWGRLLADSALHISNAVAMDGQLGKGEALAAIATAFDKALSEETQAPSETRSGQIKRGRHH